MTPQSEKPPREWWLLEFHTGIHNGEYPMTDMTPKYRFAKEHEIGAFQVIEKSAYEALREEVERLTFNEKSARDGVAFLKAENEKLKVRLEDAWESAHMHLRYENQYKEDSEKYNIKAGQFSIEADQWREWAIDAMTFIRAKVDCQFQSNDWGETFSHKNDCYKCNYLKKFEQWRKGRE